MADLGDSTFDRAAFQFANAVIAQRKELYFLAFKTRLLSISMAPERPSEDGGHKCALAALAEQIARAADGLSEEAQLFLIVMADRREAQS
jgi:hypothetical protein